MPEGYQFKVMPSIAKNDLSRYTKYNIIICSLVFTANTLNLLESEVLILCNI